MNKLIIVEGIQGAGKTTVTNWLREKIVYSNLYRLTGHSDKTPTGLSKSVKMYDSLMTYIESIQGCDFNLIFDRIFITEEVFCRLGHRQYSYTEHFREMLWRLSNLDFEIFIFNLMVEREDILRERLLRDKKQHLDVVFSVEESKAQGEKFLEVMKEIEDSFKAWKNNNSHVVNLYTDNRDEWEKRLKIMLGI